MEELLTTIADYEKIQEKGNENRRELSFQENENLFKLLFKHIPGLDGFSLHSTSNSSCSSNLTPFFALRYINDLEINFGNQSLGRFFELRKETDGFKAWLIEETLTEHEVAVFFKVMMVVNPGQLPRQGYYSRHGIEKNGAFNYFS